MTEYTVGKAQAGQRLDKFLKRFLDKAPDSFFYKMLRKKNITLNAHKAAGSEILTEGDVIRFFLSEDTIDKFQTSYESSVPENGRKGRAENALPLDILYEDSDILAVHKPAGLLSQPDGSAPTSLTGQIREELWRRGEITPESFRSYQPSVCHRLDRNTSGIVLAAKTLAGAQGLSLALKERGIQKYYTALVAGDVCESQTVIGYLTKNHRTNQVRITDVPTEGADRIETRFAPLAGNGLLTLLEVELLTGKTHQIRAQLAHCGFPLLGDPKYGNIPLNRQALEKWGVRGQLLHAWRVVFERMDPRFAYLEGKTLMDPLPVSFRKVLDSQGIKTDSNMVR